MENTPKTAILRQCIQCDFKCSKNIDWDRHILTQKHQNRTFLNVLEQKNAKKRQTFYCKNCDKEYKARNSLWYHEKNCNINNTNNETNNETNSDKMDKDQLILFLIKQNSELIKETSEFKNLMMEVIKTGTHNTTNNNNSHNKTFNLQLFLNET